MSVFVLLGRDESYVSGMPRFLVQWARVLHDFIPAHAHEEDRNVLSLILAIAARSNALDQEIQGHAIRYRCRIMRVTAEAIELGFLYQKSAEVTEHEILKSCVVPDNIKLSRTNDFQALS